MIDLKSLWEPARNYVYVGLATIIAAGAGYSYALGKGVTPAAGAETSPPPAEITVDVEGAVTVPGVRKVAEGSLVEDVLNAAGGLAPHADVERVAKELNRSDKVKNHQKIYIPAQGETASSGPDSELVNINTASADELDTLPGVGPSTAKKIIEFREQNGPFAAPEDLMNIQGISEKKFAEMKDKVAV